MLKKEIHELGALFVEVQLKGVLPDGKAFPDCLPRHSLEEIDSLYNRTKSDPGFDLKKFVEDHFELPQAYSSDFKSDPGRTAREHVESLWDVLTRKPDNEKSSLIPLPYPYIVPGGRFREIYYWDSYFTMLGLQVSGRAEMIKNMIDNFSYLIDHIGYIPNGNRSYFVGRSQPPFYSLMVKILCEESRIVGGIQNNLTHYLPQLEKEYQFWMAGQESLSDTVRASLRVVRMPDGSILNRYWDENDTPRPEAYKEDVELSHQSAQKPEVLFRHLRAAAESGWDFSSRWFRDAKVFGSIHTTDIIPVDLNCLLLHLEQTLAEGYQLAKKQDLERKFQSLAERRKGAIQKYCWNEKEKFYFDYDFAEGQFKRHFTLAAAFPLFFNVATSLQAVHVAEILQTRFFKAGGLTTTLEFTGQQWDAPNGWAPLQWISFKGLTNYGLNELANQIKTNWTTVNDKVYKNTGKMTEKYDVWNDHGEASGGEYPNQDGFGWTNGVYLAMTNT